MREFSLEQQTDPSCRFDWDVMRVYDGEEADPNTLIGTYCGETVPYYFRSTGRKLYVNFKSDNSQNAKGFQAAYYFVPGRIFFLPQNFPACTMPGDISIGGAFGDILISAFKCNYAYHDCVLELCMGRGETLRRDEAHHDIASRNIVHHGKKETNMED